MTPSTKNGHAPRSTESGESFQSVNSYCVPTWRVSRVESNRAASSSPGGACADILQNWNSFDCRRPFDPILSANDGTGEEREDTWEQWEERD